MIEGPDFTRVMNELKAADKKAATAIRKGIRIEAKKAADDVKREILSAPGSGKVGIRAGIAAGVSPRIDTGKSSRLLRIAASSKNLPDDRKPMLRLMNKQSWRHPVFGDKDAWVVQQGRPYFGAVLDKHREPLMRAMAKAIEDAHARIMAATTD